MRLMLTALLATTTLAAPAFAQSSPSDVADLVGARAAGGETQLQARGYAFVTVNTVRDTKWSLWWSDRQRQCIQVATSEGRYSAIQRLPDANCQGGGQPQRPDYGPPRPDYGNGPGGGDRYGPSITLVCFGGGSAPSAQYQSGYVYNSRSHRFEPQYGTTLGREGFASDLQIEIWHGRGRIRPEGKLVSPIHSGGDNGWWDIQNLVVTPDRITGEYRMNGLNKPKFEIDRRSGIIRIRAATNFTGRCDAGDWRGGGGF
ncbi:hypothetical protein HNP52_001952 [Sphingomonas kyeonggiensis]|uniref:Uncharacterized protein n=1 Tax=Sphingomonas kyeonggiensis TaxID=1268553 RepID=A0A7W7K0S0_9SPHN|nr:hypothetical protein [Sphingomonas kyeonggiensis]MBB4838883.1 hypothetical protein [Sphingomonas kyeonggiensis]